MISYKLNFFIFINLTIFVLSYDSLYSFLNKEPQSESEYISIPFFEENNNIRFKLSIGTPSIEIVGCFNTLNGNTEVSLYDEKQSKSHKKIMYSEETYSDLLKIDNKESRIIFKKKEKLKNSCQFYFGLSKIFADNNQFTIIDQLYLNKVINYRTFKIDYSSKRLIFGKKVIKDDIKYKYWIIGSYFFIKFDFEYKFLYPWQVYLSFNNEFSFLNTFVFRILYNEKFPICDYKITIDDENQIICKKTDFSLYSNIKLMMKDLNLYLIFKPEQYFEKKENTLILKFKSYKKSNNVIGYNLLQYTSLIFDYDENLIGFDGDSVERIINTSFIKDYSFPYLKIILFVLVLLVAIGVILVLYKCISLRKYFKKEVMSNN